MPKLARLKDLQSLFRECHGMNKNICESFNINEYANERRIALSPYSLDDFQPHFKNFNFRSRQASQFGKRVGFRHRDFLNIDKSGIFPMPALEIFFSLFTHSCRFCSNLHATQRRYVYCEIDFECYICDRCAHVIGKYNTVASAFNIKVRFWVQEQKTDYRKLISKDRGYAQRSTWRPFNLIDFDRPYVMTIGQFAALKTVDTFDSVVVVSLIMKVLGEKWLSEKYRHFNTLALCPARYHYFKALPAFDFSQIYDRAPEVSLLALDNIDCAQFNMKDSSRSTVISESLLIAAEIRQIKNSFFEDFLLHAHPFLASIGEVFGHVNTISHIQDLIMDELETSIISTFITSEHVDPHNEPVYVVD